MAPPIYVKGGAWTNVEDQILRAAVSKYGLTQWSRVASLLPKKTAKQSKARWNEYLNPTINRTEWSPQDDEKLLNLAKLLPNQWRSIASVMGRTSTHCLERYQKLLDGAMTDGEKDDENAVDTGYTGPGIEALPALGNAFESLPSKPDMEDMSEDEAEMLSEAKARLANTQGKKAKRKERERLLEESRRIALLQKRRELKAAGINISLVLKNKQRRKEFDYNADIPHERQPPPGLYDTSNESTQNAVDRASFDKTVSFKGLGESAKKLKRSAEDDTSENKRAKKSILDAAQSVSEVASYQLAKRQGLVLPEPGAADSNEEAKRRITQKTQELKPGGSVDDGNVPVNAEMSKLERKKLLSTLKAHLSKLPKPKNDYILPIPSLEFSDTGIGKPVPGDHEKEEKRQTLVIQKGYSILNPELLKKNTEVSSRIEGIVQKEFFRLITSDYVQFSNPMSEGEVVEGLTDKEWMAIEKQIKMELPENQKKDYVPKSVDRSSKTVQKVIDLLFQLDAKATIVEKALEDQFAATDAGINQVFHEIQAKFSEFSSNHSDEKLYEEIMHDEDVAISLRHARLNEMVEDIKIAECRAERA